MGGSIRFGVLGPLAVWRDGAVVGLRGATQRVLLTALLLAEGAPVESSILVELIWPGAQPRNPKASLQVVVSRLRAWLDGLEAGVRIEFDGAGYGLTAPPDRVDVGRFRALRAEAATAPEPKRAELLAAALGEWRGPVAADGLDGLGDSAAAAALERERHDVAAELAAAALRSGRPLLALGHLEALAAQRPLDEPLHADLALTLAAAGRQAAALAVIEQVRGRLGEELGVDPGPQLRHAQLRVLRQDLLSGPAPAALSAWRGPRGHLSTIVGRAEEERALTALVASRRLVTIVGAGGCGKTTLALHVAGRVAGDFPDGVAVLALASLTSADDVVMALGALLDVGGATVHQVRLAAAHVLRDRRLLLVLDNCEHLSAACAELVRQLLAAAPGLRVLATSRQPLSVAEEAVSPLEPLAVPVAGEPVEPETSSVALFVLRARDALPSFEPSPAVLAEVGRVCRRLDGLPLALELAASRVRVLTVEQLAARLDESIDVLGRSGGGRGDRHATLRSTVEWSFQLLDESERLLLARLSAFSDGFTVEQAEAVCADARLTRHDVLPGIVALVDKSLVAPYEVGGVRRFRLLVAVAELAAERLSAADAHALAGRHLDHWLACAREIDARPAYRDRAAACRALGVDLGNIRAAVQHGFATGRGAEAAEVVVRLFTLWMVNSAYLADGEQLLGTAAGAADSAEIRALAGHWLASLRAQREDYRGARDERAALLPELALHRPREHREVIISVLTCGKYLLDPAAIHGISEMLAAVGDEDDESDEPSTALTAAGSLLVQWGRFEQAAELSRRYVRRAARRGGATSASHEVQRLETALGLGDIPEARARRELLLRRLDEIDDPPEREPPRRGIAVYHLITDEPDTAREFLAAAIADLRRVLPAQLVRDGHLRILLAEAQRRTGDPTAALGSLRDALGRALGRSRFQSGLTGALGAALVAADLGDAAAHDLAAHWDAVRRPLGLPVPLGYHRAAAGLLGLDAAAPPLPPAGHPWRAGELHALVERAHSWCVHAT